jgi:hypothetical protein
LGRAPLTASGHAQASHVTASISFKLCNIVIWISCSMPQPYLLILNS